MIRAQQTPTQPHTHSTLLQKDEHTLPQGANTQELESEESSPKSSRAPSSLSSSCSEKEPETSEVPAK